MQKIGYRHTEETKKKMRLARAKQIFSEESREKMRKSRTGFVFSEETKRKIGLANSIALKGHIPWNKGKKGWMPSSGFKKGYIPKKESVEKMRLSKINIPWSEKRRKAQAFVRFKQREKIRPVIKNNKEYPPLWHEIRKLVYSRDKWLCRECGVHCNNNMDKKIQCHHIDYDTSNNDVSNLITLCAGCHAKTNFRRENWIIHYREKMENRVTPIYKT
jgi:hypothetical protein